MDSDGYFTIKRDTYKLRKTKDAKNPSYYERVGLKQVQPDVVKLIKENFGGYFNIQKPNAKKGKPLYGIQLANLQAHEFVKAVFPYLRLEKKQAEILLELRHSLARGRRFKYKSAHINRWGEKSKFTRYATHPDDIESRENLIKEIKSLNDTRNIPHLPY